MLVFCAFFVSESSAYAGGKVAQEDVVVRTQDGTAEAVLYHPLAKGTWPAVLFWPDILGIRPITRDLARKVAAEGFVVLVPNSFYRSARPSEAELNPADPAVRPTLMKHREAVTNEGIARDTISYIAFLDAQKQTDRKKKAASIGYDLGGGYALLSAAALPTRIAAVGSVYGLGLATARPTSPHLLVPKTKANYYVAIARDDNAREPQDAPDIRNAIEAAGLKGEVEVYGADHGWSNPATKSYDPAASDRSFRSIVTLLKVNLR
jgi:carboxymethylenebutenolidase